MNRQTVINKFIEKAGALDPKPNYHFVMGSIVKTYGLTTNLNEVIRLLRIKFYQEHQQVPNVEQTTVGECLPQIHLEYDGESYDFSKMHILNCSRMLQNSPFKDVKVHISKTYPLPIAFSRKDCDIAILLAPYVLDIPKGEDKQIQEKRFLRPWTDGKPKYEWVKQMPNCTFWLVEWPTLPKSIDAGMYGYPIGRMLKCRNCGNELTIQDWINRKLQQNHPECMCSCNTYDDFCGCIRMRERAMFDRLAHQAKQKLNFIRRAHWDIA